jgi:hypothetical protein
MLSRLLLIVCLLLNLIDAAAQQRAEVSNESRIAAAQELEGIIKEAKNLNNQNAFVNISARAAMLISYSDPVRAEQMFLELWKFSNEQTGKDFDKLHAKVLLLKYMYSRNAKLARRLMSEAPAESQSSLPPMLRNDEQTLPGKVALALMDFDPTSAAGLLQQSLSRGVTPQTVAALSRLRERDFFLGDYVAANTLDAMTTQPTLASLPGLHLLGAYVFPGAEAPLPSIEAEISGQALQLRYFSVSYDVLRASLNESNETLLRDQRYTGRLVQFRGAYQAELAEILAALAPRLQPSLAPELATIATKLAPQIPSNMPRLPQSILARLRGSFSSEDPEQRFFFSLSTGDFDAARNELDRIRDSDKRNLYLQLLIKSEARTLLAKGDLMEAVTAIRRLEDPTARLVLYMDAVRTANGKRDTDVLKLIINEARLLIPQTDRNGLHLRALLSFASQLTKLGAIDDGLDFLKGAVSTINALTSSTSEAGASKSSAEAAMAEISDPNSLLDEPGMERAFAAVGLLDLDLALTNAKKIQPKAVQLIARLQTIQGVIKQGTAKPKPSPPKAEPRLDVPKP